jgi:hypothetical protein
MFVIEYYGQLQDERKTVKVHAISANVWSQDLRHKIQWFLILSLKWSNQSEIWHGQSLRSAA